VTFSTTQSPLHLIANARSGLTDAKRRVADVLLAHPTQVAQASISWVATAAQTTPATVSRFANDLGFDGFAGMRSAIATGNGRDAQLAWEDDIGLELAPSDTAEQIAGVLARHQYMALRNVISTVDFDALTRVAEAIATAPHVHIFGRWGDEIPAREFHMRLIRSGVPAWFHNSESALRLGHQLLGESDVVVVFSRMGEGIDGEELLQHGNDAGALTVAITGAPAAEHGMTAEVTIFTGTHHGVYWTDYYAGRASDGLTASVLWILIMQRLATKDQPSPDTSFWGDSIGNAIS
jgi:DNA-binding MurR/RpiR family transcriptional regulator